MRLGDWEAFRFPLGDDPMIASHLAAGPVPPVNQEPRDGLAGPFLSSKSISHFLGHCCFQFAVLLVPTRQLLWAQVGLDFFQGWQKHGSSYRTLKPSAVEVGPRIGEN